MIKFSEYLASTNPCGILPTALSIPLLALWHAKAGNWHKAHDLCQEIPDPHGAWIHAHLHRQEGDHGNAAYWYHRANRPVPPRSVEIDQEWQQMAAFFCQIS